MRTVIIALAVTIPDSAVVNPNHDLDSLSDFLNGFAERGSVVGILDRDKPANNFEPQIFAVRSGAPSCGAHFVKDAKPDPEARDTAYQNKWANDGYDGGE